MGQVGGGFNDALALMDHSKVCSAGIQVSWTFARTYSPGRVRMVLTKLTHADRTPISSASCLRPHSGTMIKI